MSSPPSSPAYSPSLRRSCSLINRDRSPIDRRISSLLTSTPIKLSRSVRRAFSTCSNRPASHLRSPLSQPKTPSPFLRTPMKSRPLQPFSIDHFNLVSNPLNAPRTPFRDCRNTTLTPKRRLNLDFLPESSLLSNQSPIEALEAPRDQNAVPSPFKNVNSFMSTATLAVNASLVKNSSAMVINGLEVEEEEKENVGSSSPLLQNAPFKKLTIPHSIGSTVASILPEIYQPCRSEVCSTSLSSNELHTSSSELSEFAATPNEFSSQTPSVQIAVSLPPPVLADLARESPPTPPQPRSHNSIQNQSEFQFAQPALPLLAYDSSSFSSYGQPSFVAPLSPVTTDFSSNDFSWANSSSLLQSTETSVNSSLVVVSRLTEQSNLITLAPVPTLPPASSQVSGPASSVILKHMINSSLELTYRAFLGENEETALSPLPSLSAEQSRAIHLAQEFGLLPRERHCHRVFGHGEMSLNMKRENRGRPARVPSLSVAETRNLRFVCTKPGHSGIYRPLAKNSIFEDSCVTISDFFRVLIAFTSDYTINSSQELGCSCPFECVIQLIVLFKQILEACVEHDQMFEPLLGGNGVVVQVSEVRYDDANWIFGAFEPSTDRVIMEIVPDTDRDEFLMHQLLFKYVDRNSIVVTEQAQIYEQIGHWGWSDHQTVDLSVQQVNDKGYGLKEMIQCWTEFFQKNLINLETDLLVLNTAEFIWRRRCQINNLNPFLDMLSLIRRTFPCD